MGTHPFLRCLSDKKLEEIVMAKRPITDEEGSKGGQRSVMAVAIVAACLFVLIIVVGLSGRQSVAPNTPQPNTASPATSGAQTPQ
jgi:hypothetical protein